MKIAITGGIGSGKSFVCGELIKRGIRVYDCDAAAKRLMRSSSQLREELVRLVGPDVYDGAMLRKQVLARFLLESEDHKAAVNDVVHPFVARDFEGSGFDWLESAILFDSGFDKRTHFDFVVCVTAPCEERVRRIMARDHIGEPQALQWIGSQLPQEQVLARSNYEICNDGQCHVGKQVDALLGVLGGKFDDR